MFYQGKYYFNPIRSSRWQRVDWKNDDNVARSYAAFHAFIKIFNFLLLMESGFVLCSRIVTKVFEEFVEIAGRRRWKTWKGKKGEQRGIDLCLPVIACFILIRVHTVAVVTTSNVSLLIKAPGQIDLPSSIFSRFLFMSVLVELFIRFLHTLILSFVPLFFSITES